MDNPISAATQTTMNSISTSSPTNRDRTMRIGQHCMVRDLRNPSVIVQARVIDQGNDGRIRRVRLTTGENSGSARAGTEIELLEWME